MNRAFAVCLLTLSAWLLGCNVIVVPDDGTNGNQNGSGRVPLHQVRAEITITQASGSAEVAVTAELRDSRNRAVTLGSDQAIEVNGIALISTGSGRHTAQAPVSGSYEFTVREPTRGVERTTVTGPADFAIVSPPEGGAAPLSGFTLAWSNVDPALRARIVLEQTALGDTERETFTQAQDEGTRMFTVQDLVPFVQGAPLQVSVTKSACTSGLAGLSSATICVERRADRALNPAP